jgi:hypothetical protein
MAHMNLTVERDIIVPCQRDHSNHLCMKKHYIAHWVHRINISCSMLGHLSMSNSCVVFRLLLEETYLVRTARLFEGPRTHTHCAALMDCCCRCQGTRGMQVDCSCYLCVHSTKHDSGGLSRSSTKHHKSIQLRGLKLF